MSDMDFDDELYELYGLDLDVEPDEPGRTGITADQKETIPTERQAGMGLYDWLQSIVMAVLCGILIFVFVGRISGIEQTSMMNTLHDRDVVILSNLFFTPHYGDIVIIDTDAFDAPIVKRVIATEGQTIDIDFNTGDVRIDGRVIEEDYIKEPTTAREDFEGPRTVPDGCVFVMGDNRNASSDSRDARVDMIDTRSILGKVLFLAIPGKDNDGRQWSRLGSVYR